MQVTEASPEQLCQHAIVQNAGRPQTQELCERCTQQLEEDL